MNFLCQYKDVFGKPREGVHSVRWMDIAVIDVIFTLFAAWVVSYVWKVPFWMSCIGWFVLGIVAHRLFCVRTKIDGVLEKGWMSASE